MRQLLFFVLTIFCVASQLQAITGQEALDRLVEGNARFASDKTAQTESLKKRRLETKENQEPFAIILGCSDSRVPPEVIFDQGYGDLFVARVAGNVAGEIEVESIEYGALYLKAPLLLVLGHESCGAVSAVVSGMTKDIPAIAALIEPAVKEAKGDLIKAIKDNVKLVVSQLKNNPALKELVEKKQLMVRGGFYNFHSGKVELL